MYRLTCYNAQQLYSGWINITHLFNRGREACVAFFLFVCTVHLHVEKSFAFKPEADLGNWQGGFGMESAVKHFVRSHLC